MVMIRISAVQTKNGKWSTRKDVFMIPHLELVDGTSKQHETAQ
jgi:hypothetical protein